jgi:hypothetical protein
MRQISNRKSLHHGRMLSDTLTIGLVLLLLFGSIVLYLYTCIQQSEQKISLLESILLDLKMSGEMKAYTELPADSHEVVIEKEEKQDAYIPFNDEAEEDPIVGSAAEVSEYKSIVADAIEDVEDITELTAEPSNDLSSEPNYEAMTLKELQALAKSRGIMGVTKKAPLIEALKTSDRSVKPGSSGAGSNSFLETSASVSDESL